MKDNNENMFLEQLHVTVICFHGNHNKRVKGFQLYCMYKAFLFFFHYVNFFFFFLITDRHVGQPVCKIYVAMVTKSYSKRKLSAQCMKNVVRFI